MAACYTGLSGTISWDDGTWNDIGLKLDYGKSDNGIKMQWLTKKMYKEGSTKSGLAFFVEERNDFFCADPSTRIQCGLIDWTEKVEWDNYKFVLLVTGFELPDRNHPLWNTELKPKIATRGNLEDNTMRHVYEYVGDETGLGFYAGLTVHDTKGSYSSYPAHEYEIVALCAPLEVFTDFSEKFAYVTDKPGMWGIQAQSPAYGDRNIVAFKDLDILNIPLGAHFSIGGPGTRLSYLWVYKNAPKKEY